MVMGPSASGCGTVNVAVSAPVLVVTRAVCFRPAAVIVTSPNWSSAAWRVMLLERCVTTALIVARPRKVAFARSGANHSE